ncbi:MAG: hypothetical protein NTV00_01210 [Methylococcales bacterium]|nr:hypothetical protein [Methylococcales bacterium]
MTDIAIKVENLSKCYQIYDKPHQRLLQGFLGSKKQYYKEFWALKDVSFEVKKAKQWVLSGVMALVNLHCYRLFVVRLHPVVVR